MKHRRKHTSTRARNGQAMVEFALVAPVMVTILLFGMYFYELNEIKLKTQEAARYVAWEFTSYPLHDYGKSSQSTYFSRAKSAIVAEATARYLNLDSSKPGVANSYLTLNWTPMVIRVQDQRDPRIPSGRDLFGFDLNMLFNVVGLFADIWRMMSFTHANPLLVAMIAGYYTQEQSMFGAGLNRFNPPSRWGFNPRGYPKVTVRIGFHNQFIPKMFLRKGHKGFFNKHLAMHRHRIREVSALVADSWRLHYGDSIDNDSGKSKPYWKVVDRMAFVTPTVRNFVRGYANLMRLLTSLMALTVMGYAPAPTLSDPVATTLVSKAYHGRNPHTGKIQLVEDTGPENYDTSPLKPDSEYDKTFKDRGKNFMGCTEPERLTCGASLSTENPFGDYVVPPPEGQ